MKSFLPELVNYRNGWQVGYAASIRTLRGRLPKLSASSAAYLGLLLRFFDHHIAGITRRRCFTNYKLQFFDVKHRNINFRELRLSRIIMKWPTTGTVLAQYRLERIQKDGVRKTAEGQLAHKDSPPKMKVEKSAEEKNEGAEGSDADKGEEGRREASAQLVEERDDDEPPVQPVEEKRDDDEPPVPASRGEGRRRSASTTSRERKDA